MKQQENCSIRRQYVPGKPINSEPPMMQLEMLVQAGNLRNRVYAEFHQCKGCEYLEQFTFSFNPAIYDLEVVQRYCRECDKYVQEMEDFTVRHGYVKII